MASTYVNDLRLNEMATGDQSGSWGTVTNTNLELIAEAFSFGTEGITTNADTHTTTIADGGTDPGRSMFLKYTGTLDSACTITIGPNTVSKLWFIENATSGSQNIIIKQGSGATITIPPGDTKAIYSDGAGSGGKMVDAFASLSVVDLNVSGNLDVDGTTNLDAVDIDGAVNMATTALVTGVLTTTAATVFNGGFASNAASTITTADNLDTLSLVSTDADAGIGPNLLFYRNSASPAANDLLTEIDFRGRNNNNQDVNYVSILAKLMDVTDGSEDGNLMVQVMTAGTLDPSFMINPTEAVFNNDQIDRNFRVASDDNANMLFIDGGDNRVSIGNTGYNTTADLNLLGKGLSIKNDKDGSNNNWSLIQNTGTGSNSNLVFLLGDGNAVLNMDGGFTTNATTGGHSVFNENDVNADFRVESLNNTHQLYVDGGNDRIGVGTASPTAALTILSKTNQEPLTIQATTNGAHYITNKNAAGTDVAYTGLGGGAAFTTGTVTDFGIRSNGNLLFGASSNSERGRFDTSGNFIVAKTTTAIGTVGTTIGAAGFITATRNGATVLNLNRLGTGDIAEFYSSGDAVGSIGTPNATDFYISGVGSISGAYFNGNGILPCLDGSPSDNTEDLGQADLRFDDIFATNGTINTSDRNEKQDIASMTTAELAVGKRISALFKTFRWKDKVASKGNDARTHLGTIAQDVQTAFEAEGLTVAKYALWCSDTWWEHYVDVAAVEADNTVVPPIEAADAYTRTDRYYTEDEAPSGSTKKTRLGIRYPELLSFLAAYNEQRFVAIETRLTALEG